MSLKTYKTTLAPPLLVGIGTHKAIFSPRFFGKSSLARVVSEKLRDRSPHARTHRLPFFTLTICFPSTLIFVSVEIVSSAHRSLSSAAARKVEIYWCTEIMNYHHTRNRRAFPTPKRIICILMRCHPYIFLYTRVPYTENYSWWHSSPPPPPTPRVIPANQAATRTEIIHFEPLVIAITLRVRYTHAREVLESVSSYLQSFAHFNISIQKKKYFQICVIGLNP